MKIETLNMVAEHIKVSSEDTGKDPAVHFSNDPEKMKNTLLSSITITRNSHSALLNNIEDTIIVDLNNINTENVLILHMILK